MPVLSARLQRAKETANIAKLQHLLEELAEQKLLNPELAAHAWQTRPMGEVSTAVKRKQPAALVLALPVLLEEGFVGWLGFKNSVFLVTFLSNCWLFTLFPL